MRSCLIVPRVPRKRIGSPLKIHELVVFIRVWYSNQLQTESAINYCKDYSESI